MKKTVVFKGGLVTGVIVTFISVCLLGWWYNDNYHTAGEEVIVVDSSYVDTLWSLSDDLIRKR